jgi:predicted transcriptional regulator
MVELPGNYALRLNCDALPASEYLTRPIKTRVARENMEGNDASGKVDLNQIVEIVRSYVRYHQLGPEQLVELIRQVHRALASLGQAALQMMGPRQPAVPIRRSVQPDYVVCLECGFRVQSLRRHLRVQHGLSVDEYRARWNLRSDHPVIAPSYSQRRAAVAKEMGLGRRRRSVEPVAPRRRGRRRRPTTE